MLFDVYVFSGDPVDALAAGAKTGELVIKSAGRDQGLVANLVGPNGVDALLPPLRRVRLLAMNTTGMVIEGVVTVGQRDTLKSRTTTSQLRWVIKHVGAPAVLNTVKLKERTTRRLAITSASGFDPADDNG